PPPQPPVGAAPPSAPGFREDDLVVSDPRLTAAKDALLHRDFSGAFRLCDAARKQGAASPDILEMQAAIFKETGYLDKEIEALKRWTTAAPREVRPWIKLFYIYMDLGW